MYRSELKLFCGSSNADLAKGIAAYIGQPLSDGFVGRFPDGEIDVKINEDVRGTDVFIIQSTCPPVNEHIMELLLLIDCLRRASAQRITAVIPYYGYARKDRKDDGRVPITAKLVANMLTGAGIDRILTVDLHSAQIQGFFDIPVDHLFASKVLCSYFQQKGLENLVMVSPDVGGIKIARACAKRLHGDLAVVDKRRVSGDATEVYSVIGDVKGKTAILTDDMISTAGSIAEAARIVKDHGANEIYVMATHAVLAGNAIDRLSKAEIQEVVITDSIPLQYQPENLKVRVMSIAQLVGEAILRISLNKSVSALFQ